MLISKPLYLEVPSHTNTGAFLFILQYSRGIAQHDNLSQEAEDSCELKLAARPLS